MLVFSMASAHGAGFILLPVLLKISAAKPVHLEHAMHTSVFPGVLDQRWPEPEIERNDRRL
ncbi:MAG: hypothetical protein WBX22_21470, partial [Silvibacterium sp.]